MKEKMSVPTPEEMRAFAEQYLAFWQKQACVPSWTDFAEAMKAQGGQPFKAEPFQKMIDDFNRLLETKDVGSSGSNAAPTPPVALDELRLLLLGLDHRLAALERSVAELLERTPPR